MKDLKYVDVSGVGSSGKSAVVDFLREFDNFWVPRFDFEFDLFRVPHGILDLKLALTEHYSPIRSNHAVNKFQEILTLMGNEPNSPGNFLKSTGHRYQSRFNNQFITHAQKYIESFIVCSYKAAWPYDNIYISNVKRATKRILNRLGMRLQLRSEVKVIDGNEFDKKTKHFIDSLYNEIISPKIDFIVLNNGFEPFNPVPFLDMVSGSTSIAVIRDPRDMYVSGMSAHKLDKNDEALQADENDGLNKSFLGSDDLRVFIQRYKTLMKKIYKGDDSRFLVFHLEDLILNYESCTEKIMQFLDLKKENHANPQKYFDPNRSAKNLGAYKKYSKQEEIKVIEKELSEFLWDFS